MIGMVACVSVVVLIDTFGMVSYVRVADTMMKIERMKHGIQLMEEDVQGGSNNHPLDGSV